MCTPRALVITQETNFSRGFSVGLGSRDTIFPFIFFRLLFFAFNVSITQNVANTKGIPRGEAHRNSSSSVGSFGSVASSSSFSSRKGGVHKMIFYSISSTSVGFFFSFALTICPFQARKRKTRRVGNQIDGETHMRNLKLKTHKISTDILSCTNYWQLKDERGISAHTKKKKQRQRFSRQVCHPFPFFPLHNRFWFGFFFPMSLRCVYVCTYDIYIYIYAYKKTISCY